MEDIWQGMDGNDWSHIGFTEDFHLYVILCQFLVTYRFFPETYSATCLEDHGTLTEGRRQMHLARMS